MDHLNGVFVSKKLFQRMNEISGGSPRKDVNVISPVHMHFFETNNMFLSSPSAILKRTHFGQTECHHNDLVSFTLEEMQSCETKAHIKERLLDITKMSDEKIQAMVDLLQFVFTLRENKIGDGVNYTIYGFHYEPSTVGMIGVKPVWIAVIDCPAYEDCSDATEWKLQKATFPFRFLIYSIDYNRRFTDAEIIH